MNEAGLPAIVDLEEVLIPTERNYSINGSRHIAVAIALFTETATLHTAEPVGDDRMTLTDTIMFGLRDERGTAYPFTGGGGISSTDRARESYARFRRPDDHRPAQLTVSYLVYKTDGSQQRGDLFTVDVPPRG